MTHHFMKYDSPAGTLILESTGEALVRLDFAAAHPFPDEDLSGAEEIAKDEALQQTIRWLDQYFKGEAPSFTPPVDPAGTAFQKEVWARLLQIPYGETTTYGAIAKSIAEERGIPKMAPRAVGNAVGANPISIVIPCHRVIGADGNLTGYGGGIDKKIALLETEHVDMRGMRRPKARKETSRR